MLIIKKERLVRLSFLSYINLRSFMILSYISCTSLYLMIELSLIPLSPIPSTMASLKPKKLIIDLIRFMFTEFFVFSY